MRVKEFDVKRRITVVGQLEKKNKSIMCESRTVEKYVTNMTVFLR